MTRRWAKRWTAVWMWAWCIAALTAAAAIAQSVPAGAERSIGKIQELPDEISAAQAKAAWEAGAFILDVRQPEEWNEVHIPGSTLIPLGELQKKLAEIPKGRQIIVVCRSGGRSAFAREILKKAGFDQVTSMSGGMNDWQGAGYPTAAGR